MTKLLRCLPFLSRSTAPCVDLEHSFWNPPLSPSQAHRLEADQIETAFNLPALVSLTDHDDIEAGQSLRSLDPHEPYPISLEWTVPYRLTFFHLGVHNLSPELASEWLAALKRYTVAPESIRLEILLQALSDDPNVLIVVNHPLWDRRGIGNPDHEETLSDFIKTVGVHLHALEVNGNRPLRENLRVLRYGEQIGLPVVAGGDRHGCEPNAIINLTAATSFDEFTAEVRRARRSHIVYMPQYRKARTARALGIVYDALRTYPAWPEERRYWDQRTFLQAADKSNWAPLCDLRGPRNGFGHFELLDALMRMLQVRPIEAVVSLLLSRNVGKTPTEPDTQRRLQFKRKSKAKTAA